MAFFKRVEVWVLLLLSGGVAVWVLSGDGNADLPPAWTVAEPSSNEPVLTLRGCTLERDYGNARLDLRVKVRNTTIRPLMLRPPMVKLLAGEAAEVAPFFLPAEMPPDVAAGRTSEVVLRYWLEEAELVQPLVLVVNDARLTIKGAGSVALEALPNGEPVEIPTQDWTTIPVSEAEPKP